MPRLPKKNNRKIQNIPNVLRPIMLNEPSAWNKNIKTTPPIQPWARTTRLCHLPALRCLKDPLKIQKLSCSMPPFKNHYMPKYWAVLPAPWAKSTRHTEHSSSRSNTTSHNPLAQRRSPSGRCSWCGQCFLVSQWRGSVDAPVRREDICQKQSGSAKRSFPPI